MSGDFSSETWGGELALLLVNCMALDCSLYLPGFQSCPLRRSLSTFLVKKISTILTPFAGEVSDTSKASIGMCQMNESMAFSFLGCSLGFSG